MGNKVLLTPKILFLFPCIIFFQYATSLSDFAQRAMKIIRELKPSNELQYVRLSCRKYEVLIATLGFGTIIVMQKPIIYEDKSMSRFGHIYTDN